jgi:hypothetical protein
VTITTTDSNGYVVTEVESVPDSVATKTVQVTVTDSHGITTVETITEPVNKTVTITETNSKGQTVTYQLSVP